MHLHHILLIMGGFGFWVSGLGESWLYLERIKCFVCLELGVPPSNVYLQCMNIGGTKASLYHQRNRKWRALCKHLRVEVAGWRLDHDIHNEH